MNASARSRCVLASNGMYDVYTVIANPAPVPARSDIILTLTVCSQVMVFLTIEMSTHDLLCV